MLRAIAHEAVPVPDDKGINFNRVGGGGWGFTGIHACSIRVREGGRRGPEPPIAENREANAESEREGLGVPAGDAAGFGTPR